MFMVVNDLHFSDKNPGVRQGDYLGDLVEKLEEAAKISQKYCTHSFFTGDIFHSKISRNITHELVRIVISVLKKFKNPYLILGNHDLIGGQKKSIVRQPVGVVLESGVVNLLDMLLLPNNIRIYGLSYSEAFEQGTITHSFKLDKTYKNILIAHASLNTKLRFNIIGKFDRIFYGHIHFYEGQNDQFVNLGAMSRITSDRYNRERKIKVAIVNKKLQVFEYVIKCQKPWNQLFCDGELMERSNKMNVSVFMEALSETMEDDKEDLEGKLKLLSFKVRQRVEHYLSLV